MSLNKLTYLTKNLPTPTKKELDRIGKELLNKVENRNTDPKANSNSTTDPPNLAQK